VKVARPVLRGRRRSNASPLPDQLSHVDPVRSARFDDRNLMSFAGLVPALALAHRAGLDELAERHLSVPGGAGGAAGAKVRSLVAGMVAGADSISDVGYCDMVRRRDCSLGCGLPRRSGRSCGPFRFGHVRQLDAVAARFVAGLARHAPIITAGEPISYLDIEDTVRSTFGYAKQGAGFGCGGVKGLERVAGHRVERVLGAGDRGHEAGQGDRQVRPAAPPGWSPTRSQPAGPAASSANWCCGRTRPTTAPT